MSQLGGRGLRHDKYHRALFSNDTLKFFTDTFYPQIEQLTTNTLLVPGYP